MSRLAFDKFLAGIKPEEQQRILLAGMEFGLKPEDPEWIAFAVVHSTLYSIEKAVKDVREASKGASDNIIRLTARELDTLRENAAAELTVQANAMLKQMVTLAAANIEKSRVTIVEDTVMALINHLTRLVDPKIADLEQGGRAFDRQREASANALRQATDLAAARMAAIGHRSSWHGIAFAALGAGVTATMFLLVLFLNPPAPSSVTLDTNEVARQVIAAMK